MPSDAVITPATPSTTKTADVADLLKKVETLAESQQKSAKALEALVDKSSASPARKSPLGYVAGEGPHIRKGESALTSRGFSYVRLIQAMTKLIDADQAKVEIDLHNRLQKLYVDKFGYDKVEKNSILVPLSSAFLATSCPEEQQFAQEMGQLVKAGLNGLDWQEYMAVRKTLSYTDETALGSFVAPPVQGELIELFRNREVFMNAGARVMPLPPNGRIVFPKQTGPSAAYWVGESVAITESSPTSGDLTLQAKKLAALVKVPNELFRFSSVSMEMFLRDDIARVCSLKLDSALLQGVGGTTSPKGLINYANIGTHTATTVGANGNTFEPEDISQMVAKVEEQNAVFRGFVMRPQLWSGLVNRRADAVSAGDKKGPFVFNYLRGFDQDMKLESGTNANLYGFPVWKSTNISNTRSKGSASNLTYVLGGDFNDYIIGMSAVMEFAISTQGTEPFTQDQTWLRGIMLCDGGPRHEASFILCDTLVNG